MSINLREDLIEVTLPSIHFLYCESTGPFPEICGATWGKAYKFKEILINNGNKVKYGMSMYKCDGDNGTYRAGFCLESEPINIPEELLYVNLQPSKYLEFVLTGSYMNLGPANGRVAEIVKEKNVAKRDDFNLEIYESDHNVVPEDELVTKIYVPIN